MIGEYSERRIRGACKGCKCSYRNENGDARCVVKDGVRFKQFPQNCDKRIDGATYLSKPVYYDAEGGDKA